MMLFVPPHAQQSVRETLKSFIHVPCRFENCGSQIIFYDPEQDFSAAEAERKDLPIAQFKELESVGSSGD